MVVDEYRVRVELSAYFSDERRACWVRVVGGEAAGAVLRRVRRQCALRGRAGLTCAGAALPPSAPVLPGDTLRVFPLKEKWMGEWNYNSTKDEGENDDLYTDDDNQNDIRQLCTHERPASVDNAGSDLATTPLSIPSPYKQVCHGVSAFNQDCTNDNYQDYIKSNTGNDTNICALDNQNVIVNVKDLKVPRDVVDDLCRLYKAGLDAPEAEVSHTPQRADTRCEGDKSADVTDAASDINELKRAALDLLDQIESSVPARKRRRRRRRAPRGQDPDVNKLPTALAEPNVSAENSSSSEPRGSVFSSGGAQSPRVTRHGSADRTPRLIHTITDLL